MAISKLLWAVFAIAALSAPSIALGQPVAGTAGPDALLLGDVRTGATVEASVRVFEKGDSTVGVKYGVAPPPFARVTDVKLGTRTYRKEAVVYCDVFVSIDTAREGKHDAPLAVQVGQRMVEVPIRVNVLPREAGLTRVLIVATPFDRFSTSAGTDFDEWLDVVKSARLDPHYLNVTHGQPVLRDLDLAKFDVVFMTLEGLVGAQSEDLEKLRRFLDEGGRVVLAANYFFRGTVAMANKILKGFGLEMDDKEDSLPKALHVSGNDIRRDPLTRNARAAAFFRPSPVRVLEPAMARILVAAPQGTDAGFAAVSRSGKAEIVVLGQSLWWNWIRPERAEDTDNARLLGNFLTRPPEDH